MTSRLELHTSEHGDWARLIVDGRMVYEGHSIPQWVWTDILIQRFNCTMLTEEHTQEWWESAPTMTWVEIDALPAADTRGIKLLGTVQVDSSASGMMGRLLQAYEDSEPLTDEVRTNMFIVRQWLRTKQLSMLVEREGKR